MRCSPTVYSTSNRAECLPDPAAGASDDWAKGAAGIAKAYTIELQGGGRHGFDMPPDRILEVVTQLFEGFKVFAARAKKL